MTDSMRAPGPAGPPWSVDLLADLHAGALDSDVEARLWPRVNADPDSRAIIQALDSVKVELGRLGSGSAEPMPAQLAARLDAAILAEVHRARPVTGHPLPAPSAPVVDLSAARKRRSRRLTWGAGVLTAAAAAVAVTMVVSPPSQETSGSAVAGPQGGAPDRAPLALRSDNLAPAIGQATNQRDYGPLGNQRRLDECIAANGIDPAKAQTMGVRQVTLDGKPGVLALLTTGESARFRVLVVEPTCGPGNPAALVNTVLPGR